MTWIGVISLAVVAFIGTTAAIGWTIAGALLLALVVGLVVMFFEIGRAIDMPDDCQDFEFSALETSSRLDLTARELPTNRALSGSRGTMARSHDRVMPRRVSARQNRPRTSSWT